MHSSPGSPPRLWIFHLEGVCSGLMSAEQNCHMHVFCPW